MLYFTGMSSLESFITYTVSHDQKDRENYLGQFETKLKNINNIKNKIQQT